MKKFMVLYMAPVDAMERAMKAPKQDMQASMAEWMRWGEKNKASIVEMGAPLGRSKRVTTKGTSDVRNELGGYSIMQGESADAVAKAFVGHPHFQMSPDAKIEIVEIMSIPGM